MFGSLTSYIEIILEDHFLYCLPESWEIEISDDLFNNFIHFLVVICWGFMDILNQLFLEFGRHID